MKKTETVEEKIVNAEYEDVIIFQNNSYDTAFIGVDEDNRAVYDYDKMINHLIETDGMTYEEAVEWIEYNTIRALPYMGEGAPIIVHSL